MVERLSRATHSAARSPGACGVPAVRVRFRAGGLAAAAPASEKPSPATPTGRGTSDEHDTAALQAARRSKRNYTHTQSVHSKAPVMEFHGGQ